MICCHSEVYFCSRMKYKVIGGIVNLLSIVRPEYQEIELISKLNSYFNVDHNIFLLDSSTNINGFINTKAQQEYTPQSLYVFKIGADNITGFHTLKEINSKNSFMIVVSESANFDINVNLLTQIKRIQRLKINMKIGMFFSKTASIDDLHKLFVWCWMNRIINIFATFNSCSERNHVLSSEQLLNIFTFNPSVYLNKFNWK